MPSAGQVVLGPRLLPKPQPFTVGPWRVASVRLTAVALLVSGMLMCLSPPEHLKHQGHPAVVLWVTFVIKQAVPASPGSLPASWKQGARD